MRSLDDLVEARAEILKAEIAGLLHNVGKLDPSFIVTMVRDKDDAESKLIVRMLDIPDYHFRRFAAPEPSLLTRGQALFQDPEEIDLDALKAVLENAWEDDGVRSKALESAKDVNRFYHGNGPLYRCFPADHTARAAAYVAVWETAKQLEQELEGLNAEFADSRQALDQASTKEERRLLGTKHNQIGEQIEKHRSRHRSASNEMKAERERIKHVVPDQERQAQARLEAAFREIVLKVGSEQWTLADLLTFFWDLFYYQPPNDECSGYKRRSTLEPWLDPGRGTRLPALLALSHGEVSGAEKRTGFEEVWWRNVRKATVYGHEYADIEKWELPRARHDLLSEALKACNQVQQGRDWFVVRARELLSRGLGDTRWPVNEIDLWDYATTIAALFKAGVAGSVLRDEVIDVADMRWCLLCVSFDGFGFWGQAHHVPDMLGRRETLQKALDAVQNIVEVQYPLGNEIYRDENGSVFVVPDEPGLREMEDGDGRSLEALLVDAFDAEEVRGEVVPHVGLSKAYRASGLGLAQALQERERINVPLQEAAARWWTEDGVSRRAEVCTVCGQRPVGYVEPGLARWATAEKARQRNVCGVCLNRRGRRAQDWAANEREEGERLGPFERTIWIDEIADGNGRFALIVGRFVLDGWLDGKLIPTLGKEASFARIRRCWETTREFWLQVRDRTIPRKVGRGLRLGIQPGNVTAMQASVGPWHTYEVSIEGKRLGLCWDPGDDKNIFWTTGNLRYLGKQLGFEEANLADDIQLAGTWLCYLHNKTLPLYEPGGYLGQDQRAGADIELCRVAYQESFVPFVPLVVEPSMFMALVPAKQALEVVRAIKAKYDVEMARVRDRLPMNLGLVFAPRHTPLVAVLEAGRAMLEMPSEWEAWEVTTEGRRATFRRDGRSFSWVYPTKMGDSEIDDRWYPHLVLVDPVNEEKLDGEAGHFQLVEDLTGTAYVRPARFDFEFLDTTARRFAIRYDGDGHRSRTTRPFLLEDLDRLESLWDRFAQLKSNQINQIVGAIEATREMWGLASVRHKEEYPVFWRFVSDTLAGARWPEQDAQARDLRWHTWSDTERQALIAAAACGELADWAELHLRILKDDRKE